MYKMTYREVKHQEIANIANLLNLKREGEYVAKNNTIKDKHNKTVVSVHDGNIKFHEDLGFISPQHSLVIFETNSLEHLQYVLKDYEYTTKNLVGCELFAIDNLDVRVYTNKKGFISAFEGIDELNVQDVEQLAKYLKKRKYLVNKYYLKEPMCQI